ncbi:MAG: DNA mismatch endonuclease Vsr, partial [Chloroflexota bacterium]|nr:DNA mismatch endonuclease Vsr [Chloroflexota bacterium]
MMRDISAIMRRVHSTDTTPEMLFRRALWARGLRYKTSPTNIPGKPDVVLASRKLAVFIDGDYWHGGQWMRRSLAALEQQFSSTVSREYWLNKIRRNMERDFAATDRLLSEGWRVLRFWESDVVKNVESCVDTTLEAAVGNVQPQWFSLLPARTVLEFFAGIGLMRMGLEKHGWRVVFANDIDPLKHEMYRTQYPDTDEPFVLGDVHLLDTSKVPTATLATASFPCNDLSVAGSRDGLSGKQSSAFWGFMRVLEEMGSRRPPLVIVENVVGFLRSHRGADLREALLALNHLGYGVDAFILDAASFVPQSRERLFVIGVSTTDSQIHSVRETRQF